MIVSIVSKKVDKQLQSLSIFKNKNKKTISEQRWIVFNTTYFSNKCPTSQVMGNIINISIKERKKGTRTLTLLFNIYSSRGRT